MSDSVRGMDWSKLDPNTVTVLGGLVIAAATALWHKLRGDQEASFEDTLRGLGKGVIHTLLVDPAVTSAISVEALRSRASDLLWRGATAIGVPRNVITEKIMVSLVEHVVGDVLEKLRVADGLQVKLDQLNAQVSAIPALIAKTEADALARGRAWAAENVEIVPPDQK